MSKRLDELKRNFDESRAVAAELNEESAGLKDVLAVKQAQVMETVRKDLSEFYEYGKDLDKGWLMLYLDDCKLDFYKSSYGDSPTLIVAFEPQGYVKLKANPSGYSHRVDVYDLKQDTFGWYGKECKAFITENWGRIRDVIENELAKALERASVNVVQTAVATRDALQESIGAVSENIDWSARKDAVLHNALTLLLDDVWETSDDRERGLLMLLDELGADADELEAMGISLVEFDLARSVSDVLEDAVERSNAARESTSEMREKAPFGREEVQRG